LTSQDDRAQAHSPVFFASTEDKLGMTSDKMGLASTMPAYDDSETSDVFSNVNTDYLATLLVEDDDQEATEKEESDADAKSKNSRNSNQKRKGSRDDVGHKQKKAAVDFCGELLPTIPLDEMNE